MQNQKGNTSVVVSFIIVALVVIFIIYSLMHKKVTAPENSIIDNTKVETKIDTEQKETTTKLQDNKTEVKKPMDTNKRTLANFTPTSSVASLQKIDLVEGKGEEVKQGSTVSVHYTGAVAATGEVFQSSKDFGTNPITFPLSGVIKGWTDGIPGMKVGGTRRLVIPAAMAYGATPPQGSGIPANADLVFDVELIAFK